MRDTQTFKMHEFSSRKLWEIVSTKDKQSSEDELLAAIRELAQRRHYLNELQQLGKLSHSN